MEINWNSPDAFAFGPGIYRCRVKSCEQSASKNGDPMLILSLIALDWGHAALTDDRIMLGGKGMRFGLPRLVALGIPRGTSNIDAADMVGREIYVAMNWREWDKTDGTKVRALNVDTGGSPFCGYWPITQPPQNICLPSEPIPEPADVDSTPF